MSRLNGLWLLMALSLAIVSGCGSESGPETVDVSGTVTVDGKPVEGAEVNFFSSEANFLATGMTDAEGKFTLYQGAVAGENKVWISHNTSKSDVNPEGLDPAENPEADSSQTEAQTLDGEGGGEALGEQLPPKFSNPDQSVLKFSVPAEGTEAADFKLTSK